MCNLFENEQFYEAVLVQSCLLLHPPHAAQSMHSMAYMVGNTLIMEGCQLQYVSFSERMVYSICQMGWIWDSLPAPWSEVHTI